MLASIGAFGRLARAANQLRALNFCLRGYAIYGVIPLGHFRPLRTPHEALCSSLADGRSGPFLDPLSFERGSAFLPRDHLLQHGLRSGHVAVSSAGTHALGIGPKNRSGLGPLLLRRFGSIVRRADGRLRGLRDRHCLRLSSLEARRRWRASLHRRAFVILNEHARPANLIADMECELATYGIVGRDFDANLNSALRLDARSEGHTPGDQECSVDTTYLTKVAHAPPLRPALEQSLRPSVAARNRRFRLDHHRRGSEVTVAADILIVDDDPLVREYVSIMIAMEGHERASAEDGAQAIEMLSNSTYDLAIVDIFMPVKEGVETIVEMRKRFPATKVIAMSGGARIMAGSQALDFALGLGAQEVLPKPFSLDSFRAVTGRVLSTGAAGHAVPAASTA